MSAFTMTAIAMALAMDAFAVSIAVGIHLKNVSKRQTFRLAWHFGFFQAMMPVLGWLAGSSVRHWIESYDHWVAFGLLGFVALNMFREAFFGDDDTRSAHDPTKGITMVMLSVATSIDALAVGFSLSVINTGIVLPALMIGLVALVFTITGLYIGQRTAAFKQLSTAATILGGIVLLGIGVNILYEHGVFSF